MAPASPPAPAFPAAPTPETDLSDSDNPPRPDRSAASGPAASGPAAPDRAASSADRAAGDTARHAGAEGRATESGAADDGPGRAHQAPPPFARHERMIAWRYLRARRAEGGVSVMTWISLIGITLAVFALIATLAVRSGFRAEFVDTILGANAHVTVYRSVATGENGREDRAIDDYAEMAERIRAIEGVTRVAPLVKGQVMATASGRSSGVEVYGITEEDLLTIPRIADPERASGDIGRFREGVAIGWEVAQALQVAPGDTIRLISPDGARTPFGTSPRVNAYEVVYVFQAGRYDIDRTRLYMPFEEAQSYFNREGRADKQIVAHRQLWIDGVFRYRNRGAGVPRARGGHDVPDKVRLLVHEIRSMLDGSLRWLSDVMTRWRHWLKPSKSRGF